MERAKLVMRRAMGRLNIAARQARSNHMLYLVLFAVAMFTVLYVLGKVRGRQGEGAGRGRGGEGGRYWLGVGNRGMR